jgi:O-antigen ligase
MKITANPHNEYLNLGVQLGIVGVLALLYLFFSMWRSARFLPTPYDADLTRALVITFALGCAFNSLLMDHAEGLFFAWAGGLLFAGLRSPQRSGGAVL